MFSYVCGEVGDEVVELIDERDLSPAHGGELLVRDGGKIPSHEGDAALGGLVDAREDVEQSGLAAAGLADHGDKLPFVHKEVNALQHLGCDVAHGVGFSYAFGFENTVAHFHLCALSCPTARTAAAVVACRTGIVYTIHRYDTIRARVTQPKLCRAPFDKRNSQRRPARNRQRRPARKEEKTACDPDKRAA